MPHPRPRRGAESLPRLDGDPDARLLRWGWLFWAAITLDLGWAFAAAPARDPSGALRWALQVPLIALWLLWGGWRGARFVWHWLRDAPLAPWDGRYYAFDDRQIRVLLDDQDRLLIVASDVFDVLRIEGRGRNADRVRAIIGRDGLRTLPGTGRLAFTVPGLQGWLARNSRRDARRFSVWLRTQVSEPHDRLLERKSDGGLLPPQ